MMDNNDDDERVKKAAYKKKWYQANRERLLENQKIKYEKNKEKALAWQKEYYKKNRNKEAEKKKKRYKDKREELLAKMKKYRDANKEKIAETNKRWYAANREQRLARMKIYGPIWCKANAKKLTARTAKRRSKKLQATPPWLTKLDLDHIAMFYEAAADQKQYGLDCHVDHIIPLQGREVCGLHVPWNLQVLPASENISKGNRL